ncbi:hypothetical protein H310_00958 [Aphanomyces invadans]|uniref:Uncharacterized protein n=1 Tax=Aphanomyces invadans TaxID=157072 RepID=A0A024UQ86_9STRA|nr:hypothetical protein H310_00958 [Aphanomyces invadans]ETW08360.1 hypothetical protein H310_00958 [Aphanomyces invadans]|eukprot:XP_008862165.1 hypothetical protein H310_00958 [Aphanomyces invadans]
MNVGGDLSMHTMAVHAPDSSNHFHRQTSSIGANSTRRGRRQRSSTNGSDSSSATQSSCADAYVEGMYDYKPVFQFNLTAMVRALTESVGNNNLRSPQPTLTPSPSIKSMASPSMKLITTPSMSFHSGRKVRLSDQHRTKGQEVGGHKRDKKYTGVNRVDMA